MPNKDETIIERYKIAQKPPTKWELIEEQKNNLKEGWISAWKAREEEHLGFYALYMKLGDLGWPTITPLECREPIIHYLCEEGISYADIVGEVYGYHGSSTAFFAPIKEKGLNSSECIEVNPGLMESGMSTGVCFSADFNAAYGFADLTVSRLAKRTDEMSEELSKKGVDISGKPNQRIVFRWQLSGSLVKESSGFYDSAVQPNELQFSLDLTNWFPVDKFNLENREGQALICPDYANLEIQTLAGELDRLSLEETEHPKAGGPDNEEKGPKEKHIPKP